MTGVTDGIDVSGTAMVLLLAPVVGDQPMGACAQALGEVGDALDRVVGVTVTGTADDWLATWETQPAAGSTAVSCIDIDGQTRSVAQSGPTATDATVERLSDPTDLEAIGRQVSDVFERADEADESVGVALHSLSALLRHTDESTAFKFVYTLGEVTRRVDGIVFFHLDPDAHDPATVETFRIVCDGVVDIDHTGTGR